MAAAAGGGSSSSSSLSSTYHPYRSHLGDTTLTKVFVGGLAWETRTDKMRDFFEQFGEILEAVIITDKNTGKSKGYGFVTFGDPESAKRAVADANPMIDGRRANCNIASAGRPRQSPPLGRGQGQSGHGGSLNKPVQGSPNLVSSVVPVPNPVTLMYPQYGYTASYNPVYGYNQAAAAALYNQQQLQQVQYYHQQLYGPTSHNLQSPYNPYYYGYSMHVATAARVASAAGVVAGGGVTSSYPTVLTNRSQAPYLYYSSISPLNMSPTGLFYPQLQQHHPSASSDSSRHQKLPSQLDSQASSLVASPEREGKVVTSGSP